MKLWSEYNGHDSNIYGKQNKFDNTIYHLIKYNKDGSFSKIKLNNDFFKKQDKLATIDNNKKLRSDSLFYKQFLLH